MENILRTMFIDEDRRKFFKECDYEMYFGEDPILDEAGNLIKYNVINKYKKPIKLTNKIIGKQNVVAQTENRVRLTDVLKKGPKNINHAAVKIYYKDLIIYKPVNINSQPISDDIILTVSYVIQL